MAVSDAFSIAAPTGVGEIGPVLALSQANPMTGALVLRFSLARAEAAALSVYDVVGRRVATRQVGELGPGWHSLRIDEVPPGIYIVRLAQSGRQVSARVAMIR